ncbi:MAG: histidinol-phosphatase HisJ family protein [Clostridiales bacterium]|nr:histidinol-phosphatase HisJ family protein [Clostridiales bacterium]
MEYLNLIDMHTHSDNSFDGNHSCMYVCEMAVQNKLKGIAITDHCEIDSKDLDFRAFCLNQYMETLKAKNIFKGKIDVMQGLEIGQAIYNKPLADKILSQYNYDFVLGSLHNFENEQDFYFLDYRGVDIDALLARYFDGILELCRWGNFDSLAHLTYPLRYIYKQLNIYADLSTHIEKIEEILSTLIKNNKALEINTSGLFMEISDTLPGKYIIKLFKKLGGKYITIGSDAHFAEKTGQGIEIGMRIAYECGFKNITVYKNHEPIAIEIK